MVLYRREGTDRQTEMERVRQREKERGRKEGRELERKRGGGDRAS
jgi:hypothetical protein